MSDPVEVGYIARDDRNRMLYFVMEADGEAYIVHEADFQQFLTRYAIKGGKITEIEKLME